jgi:hypothetical protein
MSDKPREPTSYREKVNLQRELSKAKQKAEANAIAARRILHAKERIPN